MDPNFIVAGSGEPVNHIWVRFAAFQDDALEEDASDIVTDSVPAIVSMPSDKELRSFQGRSTIPTLRLTVDSELDIQQGRLGRPDRIRRGGQLYQVEEVRNDIHPLVGIRKKTVYLSALPGR